MVRRMSSASALAVSAICCSSRAPAESPVVARTLRMLSARVRPCWTASRSDLRLDRLEQVIARFEPHGGHGGFERSLPGDEQQLQPRAVRKVAAHRAEELDPIGRGHVDVADDDVDLRATPRISSASAADSAVRHAMALLPSTRDIKRSARTSSSTTRTLADAAASMCENLQRRARGGQPEGRALAGIFDNRRDEPKHPFRWRPRPGGAKWPLTSGLTMARRPARP